MGHRDDRGPDGGVRHLVWDWNGTLFDDHVAVVAAINDALASLRLRSIDADTYRTHFTRPGWPPTPGPPWRPPRRPA